MAAVTAPELAQALADECDDAVTAIGELRAAVEAQYPNDPSNGISAVYLIIDEFNTRFSTIGAAMTALAGQQ